MLELEFQQLFKRKLVDRVLKDLQDDYTHFVSKAFKTTFACPKKSAALGLSYTSSDMSTSHQTLKQSYFTQ